MSNFDATNGWRSPPIGLLRASKLYPWLTDSGSLSARIQQHFAQFNLVRLNQKLAPAHADEAALLGVRASTHVMVREVILRDGETPLIFAHTVVARDAAQSAWHALRKLGTRPLAQLLFNDKRIESGALRYRHLNTAHPLMAKIKTALPNLVPQRCWARRRVFEKAGQRLIVTEVFLGAITEAKNHA
jgi:chorismate lyase